MSSPDQRHLSQGEFIALIAMLFATVALSIDAMLPALPEIAAALTPDKPNNAQLVVTSFVFGMGLGTLVVGPLSDAFGRKTIVLTAAAIYCFAAILCWWAPSLEILLGARVLMGIGAAGPRTVTVAIVRDLYKGREMARIVSYAMMFFTIVPAIAPLMGQAVMSVADWQAIFLVLMAFTVVMMLWFSLRQPETLPPQDRRPLALATLTASSREVFAQRVVLISVAVQSLTQAALFATLSSMQGIFEQRFNLGPQFPTWFAVIAILSASGSLLNARLVMRQGMRRVITGTYAAVLALTLLHLFLIATGLLPEMLAFPAHILWSVALFAMMGLTMGNLNALAMEPLGHVAGLASSLINAMSTVIAVVLAVPVGLAFNGTAVPLMVGVAVATAGALALMKLAGPPRPAASR